MPDAPPNLRVLWVYIVCLPLAIFLGYLLASPSDIVSLGWLAFISFVLIIPLLLRWYHAWLIITWNMTLVFGFLPGSPPGWLLLSILGFIIGAGQYILNRRMKFVHAPTITRSLIFLT